MTQEVDSAVERNEHRPSGSASVALRRLTHPERDGGVVEDHPVSQLIRRLARDLPGLLEEVVSLVERRIAEARGDDGAALAMAESVAPVKPEVAARFGALAKAEGMGFAELLEHMLDVYEASRKRKTDDHVQVPRRLMLLEHVEGEGASFTELLETVRDTLAQEQEERGRR
jgi:hypothetical protein